MNPAGLPVGTYQGSVNVTTLDAAGGQLAVPVTLNIISPLAPTTDPTAIPFVSSVRSVPDARTLRILRPGGDRLTLQTEFSAFPSGLQIFRDGGEDGPQWVTTSVIPPGSGDATVMVRVNPAAVASLSYGSYTGAVRVTAGSQSPRTITVPVTVELRASTINITGQCPGVFAGEPVTSRFC